MLHRRTLLTALGAVVLGVAPCLAQPPSGYVVQRVVDGDTVWVSGLGAVRLLGVDTPEVVDPRRPVQRFGKEVSAFTRRMLLRQPVRVEFDQPLVAQGLGARPADGVADRAVR